MDTFVTLQKIDEAADAIRSRTSYKPRVGMILGSGLNALADSIQKPDFIPYSDLPNWPRSTVLGHAGRLVIGELEGQPVFVMQGRVHFYEGYSMSQITLPVRVMLRLGLEMMIVTNAAGGINPGYAPGDVMLITDNLNIVGMAGANPLMGPNIDELGPRFPDMSRHGHLRPHDSSTRRPPVDPEGAPARDPGPARGRPQQGSSHSKR